MERIRSLWFIVLIQLLNKSLAKTRGKRYFIEKLDYVKKIEARILSESFITLFIMANLLKQKRHMFLIFCKQIGLNKGTMWKNKYNSAEPLISCMISSEKTPQISPLLFFLLFSFPILNEGSVFYIKPSHLEPHKTLLKILLLS